MKKITLLLAFLVTQSLLVVNGQSFTGKTNDLVFDFKNPSASTVVTNLPQIRWVSPKPEYTNTEKNAVDIEATISSDVEIKSIKIIVGDGTTSRWEKPMDVDKVKTFRIKQPL